MLSSLLASAAKCIQKLFYFYSKKMKMAEFDHSEPDLGAPLVLESIDGCPPGPVVWELYFLTLGGNFAVTKIRHSAPFYLG